jgi:polysaccharide chain length determinant protein (PEP-CTERM system associated)
METGYIIEIIKAVWRELIEWRFWVVGVFVLTSFAVLGVGMKWPEKYQTSTMLYADVTNIIGSLLEGQAEVTQIDRSEQARELIYTRRVMSRVATDVGLIDANTPVDIQEARINGLRNSVQIQAEGQNYFSIVYSNTDQDRSFQVLNAVVDAFIGDTSERRRQESRNAYEFIEQQVVSYKRQLILAENELKEFKARDLDGTQASVNARINQLRLSIDELKLTIGEIDAKERSIAGQLRNEGEYLNTQNKLDEQKARLNAMRAQLDVLRLTYQETYPDVVSLKEQINSQELVIEAMQDNSYVGSSSSDNVENPLYEELRKRQTEAESELLSQKKRLQVMEGMLAEEYERAERVASKEADLSELVRDYDVTREIYEEMLGRKEKARLSMTLDVEGQGVSFKIQEPAVYPLQPSGLRFIYFAIAAPFVGLAAALGLIVCYVVVDPRVRSPSQLMSGLPSGVEVLAIIPHVNTVLTKRLLRADMLILAVILVIAVGLYSGAVWSRLNGVI